MGQIQVDVGDHSALIDHPDDMAPEMAAQQFYQSLPKDTNSFLSLMSGVPVTSGQMNDVGTRFDVARSPSMEDRAKKVEQTGAEVRLATLPDGRQTVLFRQPGDAEFRQVDEGDFLSMGQLGHTLGYAARPEVAAGILTALATRGAGFAGRATAQAGAGAVSGAANQGIEKARGYGSDETLGEAAKEGAIGGVVGEALGSAAGAGVRGVASVLRGRGPTEEAARAFEASKALDLPSPTYGSVNPLFGARERQIAQTSGYMRRELTKRGSAAYDRLAQMADAGADVSSLSDAELGQLLKQSRDDIARAVGSPKVMPAEAGAALEAGREAWRTTAKANNDRLYAKARALTTGDEVFDLAPLQERAAEIAKGVTLPGRGNFSDVQASAPLGADLTAVVGDILKAKPALQVANRGEEQIPAYEALKELRARLYDLKQVPDGQIATQQNRYAGQLYDQINKVMDAPYGGTPEFKAAWKSAADSYRDFAALNDFSGLMKIAKSDTPDKLAMSFYNDPGLASAIDLFKKVMPAKNFETFREGFASTLMRSPEGIEAQFARWDKANPAFLETMLTPVEKTQMLNVSRQLKGLGESALAKLNDAQVALGDRAIKLIQSGTPQELEALIAKVGGKDTPLGRTLEAGVFQNILRSATVTRDGVQTIDSGAAIGLINSLEQSGKLGVVMRNPDALNHLRSYLSFLNDAPDVGGSMRAAGIASGLPLGISALTRPDKVLNSMLEASKDFFQARLLTNDFFIKAASRMHDNQSVRTLADAIGSPTVSQAVRVMGIAMNQEIQQAGKVAKAAEKEAK